MEDQTSWKGHSFTLLVFTGIVVLCSIFFILGMLVGRAQGQKLVANAPAASSAKNEVKVSPKDDKPDLTFFESRKEDSFQAAPFKPAPQPDPPPVETPKEKPATAVKTAEKASPAPITVINWQIAAVRKDADAQKLLDEVKKKGFKKAFILAPAQADSNPYFRVQVGPFSDVIEAQDVKKRLEEAKYQPILKK
jgi:cell division septation protein DedD